MSGLKDFLNGGEGSSMGGNLNEQARTVYSDVGPEVDPPEPEEIPEHKTWENVKRSDEEILAMAELSAFKYAAMLSAAVSSTLSLSGVMPPDLSPVEQRVYDDYLQDMATAKKQGQKMAYDLDDPIFGIIRKKKDYEKYMDQAGVSPEEHKMLKRALYIQLKAKNDRGELGEQSVYGVLVSIALGKLAPSLGQLVPLLIGKVSEMLKNLKK